MLYILLCFLNYIIMSELSILNVHHMGMSFGIFYKDWYTWNICVVESFQSNLNKLPQLLTALSISNIESGKGTIIGSRNQLCICILFSDSSIRLKKEKTLIDFFSCCCGGGGQREWCVAAYLLDHSFWDIFFVALIQVRTNFGALLLISMLLKLGMLT